MLIHTQKTLLIRTHKQHANTDTDKLLIQTQPTCYAYTDNILIQTHRKHDANSVPQTQHAVADTQSNNCLQIM